MANENDIYQALVAAVAPVPVYRINAPQLDDDHPVQTPYLVFERDLSLDYEMMSFCGAAGHTANYIVDCLHHDYSGARKLIAEASTALRGLSLEFEQVFESREPGVRIYRCSGSFSNLEDNALVYP